jgi:hypothetical protein
MDPKKALLIAAGPLLLLVVVLAALVVRRATYDPKVPDKPWPSDAAIAVRSTPAGIDAAVAPVPADAREPTAEDLAARKRAEQRDAAIAGMRAEIERFAAERKMSVNVEVDERRVTLGAHADTCNARLLLELRRRLVSAKHDAGELAGRLRCSELGDEIDLHTADGCIVGDADQLIITDAGAERDRFATALNEAVGGGLGKGFLIGAFGCDATILGVTLTSDNTGQCDLGRLQDVKAHGADKFIARGFKALMCNPDGPVVPLR